MSRLEFTAEQLHDLLEQLTRRVAARGGQARLLVVGGAALALSGDSRRVTTDIDAVPDAASQQLVMEEAAAMATDLSLPQHWLNDAVRAFTPPVPPEERVPSSVAGVDLASDKVLAAMKLVAFRATDLADLERLFTRLDLTSAEAAADLTIEVYGEEHAALPDRGELTLCASAILHRLGRL